MLISRQRLQRNFTHAAPAYDAQAEFQHQQTQRLLAYAESHLPSTARILDIGCGTAQFARLAAQAGQRWNITGLDLAHGMCHAARAHLPAIVQGDAAALPFADGTFDAVVSSFCLQWVEDSEQTFHDIARVLQPHGRAILITLTEGTLAELHHSCAQTQVPLTLLPMRPAIAYLEAAQAAGLHVRFHETQPVARRYDSPQALLRSMRRIGAGAATPTAPRLTPAQRDALFSHYAAHHPHPEGGVIAHWQPLLMDVSHDSPPALS